MRLRDYLHTYILVHNLNDYRASQQKEVVRDENELDENYYRVEDEPHDGRGNF